MTRERSDRAAILQSCGARGGGVDELLAYAEGGFSPEAIGAAASADYPIADELQLEAWDDYAAEAARDGVAATLRRHLIQLRFPILHGMSEREDFKAATRRGILPPASVAGATFADERALELIVHPTAAGRLPVIIAGARADFELLVRALIHRNEPVDIPPSMGACMVAGYNDWSRVARLGAEWPRAIAQKERYQDRFVLLSRGPYSAVASGTLGLPADEWLRLSLTIRLEHECAHYFTKRVFGSMRNSLLDELIADYSGIIAARGRFERDWLLRFMGVENATTWRPSGRLVNYRGKPPLSDGAFSALQTMVRRAADTLDRFDALVRGSLDAPLSRSPTDVARAICAIAAAGLEGMVESGAEERLFATFQGGAQLAS